MKKVASAVVAICLAGMVAPSALAENWTWDGGSGNWTDDNWTRSGGTGGYPNVATDNVTISGGSSDVALDVVLITIGSLKMTDGATVTVQKQVAQVGVLKIVGENGLRLEDPNTKLLIEGGVVELTGGGDVLIADDGVDDMQCEILFQTVDDGRLVFGGAKMYVIVPGIPSVGGGLKDSIRTDGVHGFIDGGSGGDEVVMLFDGRIRGNITITAQLINAGEVINDPNVLTEPLTLCGRPKMGSGLWRAGKEVNPPELGKIIADAIVVGDPCSVVDVEYGTIDVNTFWVSGGMLDMSKLRDSSHVPTRLEVAAGKIMQFGLRQYCPSCEVD